MSSTGLKSDALAKIATRLEDLITPDIKGVFKDLVDAPMLAGNIDAGIWLQDRCYDRRAGLAQHVSDLDTVCEKLATRLRAIATKFTDIDSANASDVEATATDLINEWIKDVKALDRPKPTFQRDDYNTDDHATPTDQGFTWSDNGKSGNDHTVTVNLGGPIPNNDFEANFFKDLNQGPTANPSWDSTRLDPGFQVPDKIDVHDGDPI